MGLAGCTKSLSLTVKVIVRGDRNCHRMSQENIETTDIQAVTL